MTKSTILLTLAWLAASPALAAERTMTVNDRAKLIEAVRAARPGTTILIAPGTYRGGLDFRELRGTKKDPIVVGAADTERPPVFEGTGNGIHLVDASYVELRDLEFRGASANGLNIDDGGSFDTPARGIVLRRLTVRDVGPKGNRDGIKMSGLVDFRVEDCRVERWGDGGSGIDMVGCHNGVIERCSFRHERAPGANGVQAKGGSRDITVKRCRFENTGDRGVNIGGSTGRPYFRPRPEGFEAKDITVEDCTFIGCGAAVAFVGVDGAIVRHNTVYRPKRWILRILQETQDKDFVPSRRGQFVRNIVAYRTDELRIAVNIGPGTDPKSFVFAENLWYAIDRPDRSAAIQRALPTPERQGKYGVDPLFKDAEEGDLGLRRGSPAQSIGVRPQRNAPKPRVR